MLNKWEVSDMAVGDTVSVQIVNKKGDRNLDGGILEGKIKDLVPEYNMVRLESGWCCHTKDRLLKHEPCGLAGRHGRGPMIDAIRKRCEAATDEHGNIRMGHASLILEDIPWLIAEVGKYRAAIERHRKKIYEPLDPEQPVGPIDAELYAVLEEG